MWSNSSAMRRRRLLLGIGSAVVGATCGYDKPDAQVVVAGSSEPRLVSMVSLIADPTRHHGTNVATVGVVRLDVEGTVLYLHVEDYDRWNSMNAMWLVVRFQNTAQLRASLQGRYVMVRGRVDAHDRGFGRMYPAAVHVESIEAMPEPIKE